MKNKRHKLRNQLFFTILGFSVLTIIIFLVIFANVKTAIVSQYSEAEKQSVSAVSRNIDYTLGDIENLSKSILFDHGLVKGIGEGKTSDFLSELNGYYNSNINIEGIYIKDKNNIYQIGTNIINAGEDLPFDKLEGTKGEIIWVPTRKVNVRILSGSLSRRYFTLARKIVDINSLEDKGALCIEVDEQLINETYAGIAEKTSDIYVISEGGEIISSNGSDKILTSLLSKILDKKGTGVFEYKEKNKDFVAIYSTCNGGNWYVIKTTPKSELYASVNILQRNIFIVIGVLFALLLMVGFAYVGRITKPITSMREKMKAVEKGDFSVRVDTDINNEIGELGESFNHMNKKIEALMEDVITTERNKNEMELEVLHAQINPHFLYNTLNTIRMMAKIKGEESISNAIVSLVKLLRVSISLGKKMITLEEEIDYVENYLHIQRLRFNQNITIAYDVSEEYKYQLIPKLILQPIIENSIIYNENENEVYIHVYTEETDNKDEILIIVSDNGPGISDETMKKLFREEKNVNKFSKVGLNNVNQRIKMYFGNAYGLRVISDKGTKVIIHIPKCEKWNEEANDV